MITTKEELDNIKVSGSHYKPEKYLANYLFSQEILLNYFCTDYFVYCYEDYYYNDISIDMIMKYQPHINESKFIKLWNNLNIIREIELFCNLVLLLVKNKKKLFEISTYFYVLIEDLYSEDTIINDFNNVLKTNKFIKYYNLYISPINTEELAIQKAEEILKFIPSEYTNILL
jgi:hypothetical protein